MALRTLFALGESNVLRGGTPHLRPLESSGVLPEKRR